jgi:hypothetical protein
VESLQRKLETDLLDPDVRRDTERVAALLAEQYCEFGSSGRIYTKQETLDALRSEQPVRFSVTDLSVTMLAAGAALVTYRATRQGESTQSLRSSVWIMRDGRWQMLFHQGTRVSA